MRMVDMLYALPYILLVIFFKIALEAPLGRCCIRRWQPIWLCYFCRLDW